MSHINILFFIFIFSSSSSYGDGDGHLRIEHSSHTANPELIEKYSKLTSSEFEPIESDYSGNYRLFVCNNTTECKDKVFIAPKVFFTQEYISSYNPIRSTDDGNFEITGNVAILNGLSKYISGRDFNEKGYEVPIEYQIQDVEALKADIIKKYNNKFSANKVEIITLPLDLNNSFRLRSKKEDIVVYFEDNFESDKKNHILFKSEELYFNKFFPLKSKKMSPKEIENFLKVSHGGFDIEADSFINYVYPVMRHKIKISLLHLVEGFLDKSKEYVKAKYPHEENKKSFKEIELIEMMDNYFLNFLKKNNVLSKDLNTHDFLRYLINLLLCENSNKSEYFLNLDATKKQHLYGKEYYNLAWSSYSSKPINLNTSFLDANVFQVSKIQKINILFSEDTPFDRGTSELTKAYPNAYIFFEFNKFFQKSWDDENTSYYIEEIKFQKEKNTQEFKDKFSLWIKDTQAAFSVEDYFKKITSIVYCPVNDIISYRDSENGIAGMLHIRNTDNCSIFNENYSLFQSSANLIGFFNNNEVYEQPDNEILNKKKDVIFNFQGYIKVYSPVLKTSIK